MTYEKVKNLNPEEFKRFCGVYPETFEGYGEGFGCRKSSAKKIGKTK